jgi:branched-subunit amino acid aminotransferase/4-amino-4-deoxychorismate lyase
VKAWLWNGSAFEPANGVPISDRGFRFGMSLFESMCVRDGAIEFWPQHQQRILTACAERDFPMPETAVSAAGAVFENARISGFARIYITAGDGGPAAPVTDARVFLIIEPREPEREDSWEITFHDDFYHPMFGGLKTANYWLNADALAQAREKKFDEALLCNDFGELVSACCANLFIVKDDRILTPSRKSGCRAGVVREWVIQRRKVEERRLRREDAVTADEIFLTNSWLGIMPVATLEGRPLGPRSTGPKLAAEFADRRECGADNLSA